MLDFRIQTFLTLCETLSYTKTAALLHITQPTVTQHIKFLENEYGCKLFCYSRKSLSLTERGELLRSCALGLRAGSERAMRLLRAPRAEGRRLRFGATLSIGEYVMPALLERYLSLHPQDEVQMTVQNTQSLLHALEHGEISFAFIEGNFSRRDFASFPLSEEEFVPLCAGDSPLARQPVPFGALVGERLILRERGSGTREVLESILSEHNLPLTSFPLRCELGSFGAIKRLVAAGMGITFAYREVAAKELQSGELSVIPIERFAAGREFSFVCLQNDIFMEDYLAFYHFCKERRAADSEAL
ncbi:LysR family transcriptional regulator [Harryflintia acetispora]|uniref:DNA-binding transcriptional LysR family regulator n=1 Tax=Harryflintia acetispora TaxID=1849041 RepID=A0A9X8UK08_9FIRM|nr:LysR family transcriptional regulator [Harryflintia acetispora]TCL43529.1 DNA-binding transcriptional LysR family regulator [Harryflintia acetispora]